MEHKCGNECACLKNVPVAPQDWYGARHTQVILLFVLITTSYLMRINLSVAIVAMTDSDASPNPDIPTFVWDDKSIILTSFFVGYVLPQVPAGQLAKNYGPKWFLTVTFAIGSLLSILTPFIAPFGSWPMIILRGLQGLMQGFIFPFCHDLLSKWVPPCERARLCTFVYAGIPFGTVLAMAITGWLSGTWLGWPYAFYLFGAAGLIWTVLWSFLGYNSPADHPHINPKERAYIEHVLGQKKHAAPPPTPWKEICTSLPVWALLCTYSGHNWGFTTLITNTPTYMANVLNFDIKSNGVLSAAPYLVFWIVSLVFSAITDFIINRKYLTVGAARKIANSIGMCVPAVALLTLGLISDADYDITNITLVLLFVAVGTNGISYSGYRVNHMDLSLVHAGTLMGLTNGIANIFGMFGPLVLQFIVTDENDPQQWAIIFYMSSAIYIAGNCIFVIFGSGETQRWNDSVQDEPKRFKGSLEVEP
ncbi:hypothetical protein RI129_010386 [Pyrocoelia pectoralis]|uniref:Putative inorganic phosphate cotransporter n=1 Tax=Pyrocoelia pectoralis TaxID=417401 RepID=A0AAN7VEE6_9COLE